MKMLIEKLDYDLFDMMFRKHDFNSAHDLWSHIAKNSGVLTEAMCVDEMPNSMCPTFRAPMICFMMLKFPNSIPKGLYDKLVDRVIRRRDIASSIVVGDNNLDFLSLVLMNDKNILNNYQKEQIISLVRDNYGLEEEKRFVSYDELLEMESPMVARLRADGLDICVSEYEYELFKDGEVKKAQVTRGYKTSNDYRKKIVTNGNFSKWERDYVAQKIEYDEQEFKQFINYYLNLITTRNGLEDITVSYLEEISSMDIRNSYGDNSELVTDLLFVKGLLDKHYQEEISLVRKVN